MSDSPTKCEPAPKWHHPMDVMKLHKLKAKKKALQARMNGSLLNISNKTSSLTNTFENVLSSRKRKNPFVKESEDKRAKPSVSSYTVEDSTDQTLFKLLHHSAPKSSIGENLTSFNNVLSKLNEPEKPKIEIVKAQGENWLPIDWTLKSKMRLLSNKPFPWNQKLKISEEASGVTGFTRCLDANSDTNLDTSPNARFHQCCLYWQQPSLPWMKLFPRTGGKVSNNLSFASNNQIKDSLQKTWFDSLRSLFQLIRTRQCPYFYACSNNFTVLFRSAGICGYTDVHALVSPTTRGFRQMLKQEEIEFTMPLKKSRMSDSFGNDTQEAEEVVKDVNAEEEEEPADEDWLKSMGINAEEIKQINNTQAKIVHKTECGVDNSDESMVLIEGVEVHSFYNFLLNCKSAVALTGPLAGVPPTLLAPVAFTGATLNALKVRENKVHVDDVNYYSLELSGPILPTAIHNLFAINPPEHNMTATFLNLQSTLPFSRIKLKEFDDSNLDEETSGRVVFGKENLSDCGLNPQVIKHFCNPESKYITNVECIKYTSDNKTFTWS